MGYTIKELVYVKSSAVHIPYFGYMIIEGPKGGLYCLDEFNSQILIRDYCDKKNIYPSLWINSSKLLCQIAVKEKKLKFNTQHVNDDNIGAIAKEYNATLLKRKAGTKIRNKILTDLNIDDTLIRDIIKTLAY